MVIRLEVQERKEHQDRTAPPKVITNHNIKWQELSYLGHVIILLILLAVVIDQRTPHPKIRDNWRVFFLLNPIR